jgi:HNH endonuclease
MKAIILQPWPTEEEIYLGAICSSCPDNGRCESCYAIQEIISDFASYPTKVRSVVAKVRIIARKHNLDIDLDQSKLARLCCEELFEDDLGHREFFDVEHARGCFDDYMVNSPPILRAIIGGIVGGDSMASKEKDEKIARYKSQLSQGFSVKVGKNETISLEIPNDRIRELLEKQNVAPISMDPFCDPLSDSSLWLYKKLFIEVKGVFTSQDEAALLAHEIVLKREKRLSKLSQLVKMDNKIQKASRREPILDEVKMFVWRRDAGQCVQCGSKENLEFDHIIPFSKGGSNTARNLQLLCEHCNRSKSDSI